MMWRDHRMVCEQCRKATYLNILVQAERNRDKLCSVGKKMCDQMSTQWDI